jgi:hypothetical protein
MWDAFRMEVSNTGANPATTGWDDYEFLYNDTKTGVDTDTLVDDAVTSNDGNPVEMVPEPLTGLAMFGFIGLAAMRLPRRITR